MSERASQVKKAEVLKIAFYEGSKWGIAGSIAAGAAMYLGHQRNAFIRNSISTSGKAGMTLMAGIAVWAIVTEDTMTDARRYPQDYGISTDIHYDRDVERKSTLKPWQRAVNWCYDHPFVLLGVMGLPVAGKIGFDQSKMGHLTISQRVMHSRVLAQMSVITLLLVTMGFKSYMDNHGRFLSDWEIEEQRKQKEEEEAHAKYMKEHPPQHHAHHPKPHTARTQQVSHVTGK